jgi:hypothetical protein
MLSGPVYLKEFHSYLLATYMNYLDGTHIERVTLYTSPSPFGPWKVAGTSPSNIGFAAIAPGLEYTVVSTNPPHIQVTVVTNYNGHPGANGGVPTFSKWDIVLGMQPYGNGDVPAYTDTGYGRINSGWQFGAGDVPGTFIRNGLVWAFDFQDQGGTAGSPYPFFHDVANNSAVLYPCYTDGGVHCGQLVSAKGLDALADSIRVNHGYSPRFESSISDLNTGVAGGNQNAPAAMQGNGTFTVAGVFRSDEATHGAIWATGNPAGDNAAVELVLQDTTSYLGLDWGSRYYGHRYFHSGFAPTPGTWYFIAAVVTAGSTAPAANLWVGVGGVLTDELSGVSRGGSGTVTPAVTATPLVLGYDASSIGPSESYAGLLVYNRALSYMECASLYQSFKIKMAERDVTVQ